MDFPSFFPRFIDKFRHVSLDLGRAKKPCFQGSRADEAIKKRPLRSLNIFASWRPQADSNCCTNRERVVS